MMFSDWKYSILLAWLFAVQVVNAQHYQFSQFYAAPTYLNPAFTGANACSRLSLNYRNQWSGIPGTFTSYQASFDHSLSRYKSSLGMQFFSDRAGLGGFTTTQVSFLYAYETRISKKVMGRAGIAAGTVQRRLDYGSYLFGDQIARNDAPSSLEAQGLNSTKYFNMDAGVLIYTKEMWYGISVAHLNQPNQSLTGGVSKLPAEIKLHGGYKYVLNESGVSSSVLGNHSLTFAFNYKKQAKFNQLDLGVYYSKDMLVVGCWYRGIPLFKPTLDYLNNDAVVFMAGINVEKFKIGYSYDLTVSKLSNANTRGTHELSMSYQFCKPKKAQKRKLVLVSCPKF